jgi:hypothetical protein
VDSGNSSTFRSRRSSLSRGSIAKETSTRKELERFAAAPVLERGAGAPISSADQVRPPNAKVSFAAEKRSREDKLHTIIKAASITPGAAVSDSAVASTQLSSAGESSHSPARPSGSSRVSVAAQPTSAVRRGRIINDRLAPVAPATRNLARTARSQSPRADLGRISPRLAGLTTPEAAVASNVIAPADLVPVARAAADVDLARRLQALQCNREDTLTLKAAVLTRALGSDNSAGATSPSHHELRGAVPADDVAFLRFDAEASRVQRERARAEAALGWYRRLLAELVRRHPGAGADSAATVHPALRFVLHAVERELRAGQPLGMPFFRALLPMLAVPDPLHVPLTNASDATTTATRTTATAGLSMGSRGPSSESATTDSKSAQPLAGTSTSTSTMSIGAAVHASPLGSIIAGILKSRLYK